MDIQPLNGILNGIGSGDEWDNQRLLQRLITQWNGIVGPTVAKHSRPLEIHNGVLQVATSTAVWAQNLSFERRRILKKLNARPDFKLLGLKEIRFSTAQWHSRPGSNGARPIDKRLNSYQQQLQWQQHPSRMPPPEDANLPANPAQSASQAFEQWSHRRQQQVRQVPLCPQCQTPAPQGELQRWGLCAFCMTQQWQAVKEANHPDGAEGEPWHEVTPEAGEGQEATAPERGEMAEMLAEEERIAQGSKRGAKTTFKKSLSKKASNTKPRRPTEANAPQVEQPQPAASRSALTDLSSLAAIARQEAPKNSTTPTGRFRDPALSGPLAPLSAEPPVLDAVSQNPWAPVTPQPDANSHNSNAHQPMGGQKTGAQSPMTQKQVAWAEAFQTQKSLEAARQAQQAELEQRVASQAQRIARDRIQAQADAGVNAVESEGNSAMPDTVNLTSGHTKPVLKKQSRRMPPKKQK